MSEDIRKVTDRIYSSRYPGARVIFLAGSIVRGEGTPYSDLDLVVIYDSLPNSFRESFIFQNLPVEAFVHNPETLDHFFYNVDRPKGSCSLAQMVVEGIEIPGPCELSLSLKQKADNLIKLGPPVLSESEIERMRYQITDIIDDMRHPRSKEELVGSGAELYGVVANYFFRTKNLWSARGKAIPRYLKRADQRFYEQFCSGFEELFVAGKTEKIIALVEELLKPDGGFLFDGYRLEASNF
jgi:predicted nucleotidyltransferase